MLFDSVFFGSVRLPEGMSLGKGFEFLAMVENPGEQFVFFCINLEALAGYDLWNEKYIRHGDGITETISAREFLQVSFQGFEA
jgi:hypothetical protein